MLKFKSTLVFTIAFFVLISCNKKELSVKYGTTAFELATVNNQLFYSISKAGETIIENSQLGIEIDGKNIGENVSISNLNITSHQENFPINGNYSTVKSDYTQAVYTISSGDFQYKLIARIFDDAVGFQYVIEHEDDTVRTVTQELTEFKLNSNSTIYGADNYEGLWNTYKLSEIENAQKLAFPILAQTDDGYVLLSEAMCLDYLAVYPKKKNKNTFGLGFDLLDYHDTSFQYQKTLKTPWRVVMINTTLDSLANNAAIYKLADAPSDALANADWIQPGRAGWTWVSGGFLAQNFDHMKAQITAVSKIGWEYMIVDDGWEHWDNKWKQVRKLCNYGDSLGVKVILWKPTGDYKAEWQTKKFGDLDTIRGLLDESYRKSFFKKAAEAGVAGLKVDFVNENNLERVNSVRTILEEAAKHHMMINFHGCSKPSGLERTYPNLIVQEAVRGMENVWKTKELYHYNTILPFTRYVIGSGDYTPVTGAETKAGSRAHQLALSVAILAPLNAFGVSPIKLLDMAELEFLKDIPVTWDEIKVLPQSRIGDVAVIAKRKGPHWYLAVLSGKSPKNLKIDLGLFLKEGNYNMLSYSDTKAQNGLKKEKKTINAPTTLNITTKVGGGFAARFTPTN